MRCSNSSQLRDAMRWLIHCNTGRWWLIIIKIPPQIKCNSGGSRHECKNEIIIIIIIMKNFNRRNSHSHHGSKRLELAQHAHTFTHTLISTQLQPRCAKRQLGYYKIWNQIFILFWRYLRSTHSSRYKCRERQTGKQTERKREFCLFVSLLNV